MDTAVLAVKKTVKVLVKLFAQDVLELVKINVLVVVVIPVVLIVKRHSVRAGVMQLVKILVKMLVKIVVQLIVIPDAMELVQVLIILQSLLMSQNHNLDKKNKKGETQPTSFSLFFILLNTLFVTATISLP